MKTVYIAGPFRAETAWLIEENIRNAERVGLLVASMGAIPFIPHSMYRFFSGEKSDEYWLEATLELMRRADALVLCRGWRDSSGSRGEFEEAKRLGMPIFDIDSAGPAPLAAWIDVLGDDDGGKEDQQQTFQKVL
jgi:hypothetical protein